MLALHGVTKRFGNLLVLNDVTMQVAPQEILGIAGPNGAGKSTLLNACTGMLSLCDGEIRFDDRKLDGVSPDRACHMGVARTFQIPQVFGSLSVYENVETGAWFGQAKLSRTQRRAVVKDVMDVTGLTEDIDAPAAAVNLLTRKKIMLAAALATKPKIVFMDEPFGGLNTDEIDAYVDLIARLRETLRLTFVIVEHKMRALANLSNRLLILNFGSVLRIGPPKSILEDEEVIEVYLGTPARAQG